MQKKNNIPWHEIEISASRSGGPGGQHVNKTSSRITLRWNLTQSPSFTPEEKFRMQQKLNLTQDGDVLISVDESRSQHKNREIAYERLNVLIYNALKIKKRRMKTRAPSHVHERRLTHKRKKSELKRLRHFVDD